MTTETTTRNVDDAALRSDLEEELEWDPAVPHGDINVSVTDHVVTLSGTVPSLANRLAAVRASRRVAGVHAIIDEILVVPAESSETSDEAVRSAIEHLLDASSIVPRGVRATVRNGVVTLTGTVDHQYQKLAASRSARDTSGVRWVQNDLVVTPTASTKVVRSKIVAAMHRNADLDSRDVRVATEGNVVWLSGTTTSMTARSQAEMAAWSAPGVEEVHNEIRIG